MTKNVENKGSIFFLLLFTIFMCFCQSNHNNNLPILGSRLFNGGDSIYPSINPFTFIDQDSNIITNKTFDNKIYVADFIFLSCPTICPKMNQNMLNAYSTFKNNANVLFLSHTIDPEHDSIPQLKSYSDNLGVTSNKWHFVTGNKDSIYNIAERCYFSVAYKDSSVSGGFVHSGGLLLIDKNKHIRGVYDGTSKDETERLINDINLLLKEHF